MPIDGYFDTIFASSGDIATVPDDVQPDGSVSYAQGFGADYALAYTDPDAKNIPRDKYNQLLYDITTALQQYQRQATPPFITSAMNGGSPYSYSKYNRVLQGGVVYQSLENSNTDTPPSAKWVVADVFSGRTILTANTTYYVATTGNDSNPGTIASPWLTIQHAMDYIANTIDMAGYNVTVQIADGTYSGGLLMSRPFVGGTPLLQGNTGTPTNCIISTTGNCITITDNCDLQIKGFKLTCSAGGGASLSAQRGGNISISGAMDFGATASNGYQIQAIDNGNIRITAPLTFSGNSNYALFASRSGVIQLDPSSTFTLNGTPAYGGAFANAVDGFIETQVASITGSATGPRYLASLNGVVNTNGGGASYLPGNSVGSTASGGQYA